MATKLNREQETVSFTSDLTTRGKAKKLCSNPESFDEKHRQLDSLLQIFVLFFQI